MDPENSGSQAGQRRVAEALLSRTERPRHGLPTSEPGSKSRAASCLEQRPLEPNEKPDQRCDWCGDPFNPRHGTGGSKQKFCSRECQRTSNKESQRTHRRAAYVAPKTTPAISEVDRNETLPRELGVATLHPWQTGVLDIADCDRTEFVVALNDSEAAGTRVESWPPEIRALMDHRVHRWVEDNKETRSVRNDRGLSEI